MRGERVRSEGLRALPGHVWCGLRMGDEVQRDESGEAAVDAILKRITKAPKTVGVKPAAGAMSYFQGEDEALGP